MDIKELLGFLECEKVERFQKVDSSVGSGLLKEAAAAPCFATPCLIPRAS